MSAQIFAGLILCNLIWSAHPIMGKWIMQGVTPAQGAWMRYASALSAYVLSALLLISSRRFGFSWRSFFLIPKTLPDLVMVSVIGFLAFCFSPLAQMSGLSQTLATENALIVAMEPLMSVLLAWMILRERIRLQEISAFSIGVVGFVFLTGLTLSMRIEGHVLGNLLILLSLLGECFFSVLGRKLTSRYSPLPIFGSTLAIGVTLLTVAVHRYGALPDGASFRGLPWKSLFAIFWIGPLGTTVAYLFTLKALVQVPVTSVALFLFVQPLAGALWGYLFLGDRLSFYQGLGGMMIIGALVIPYWPHVRSLARLKKKRPNRI